jgi:uncharacterized membrane protein
MPKEEENRILRVWTPLLLRSILITSAVILVVGLVLMATQAPDAYVKRVRMIQAGDRVYGPDPWLTMFSEGLHGDPRQIIMIGLLVLTLVPLARVAFCFLLFIREQDWPFVFFTAYVLSGLVVGMVLGRMG